MEIFDRFEMKNDRLKTHGLGGCVVMKSVLEGRAKIRWLSREESLNDADNGRRVIGDTDTQEYIDNAENSMVVDFDRPVEIEPAILGIYDLPAGTEVELDSGRKEFIDLKTGKAVCLK